MTALAAVAAGVRPASAAGPAAGVTAYVPSSLLASAQANPTQTFDVIMQGSGNHGADDVQRAFDHLPKGKATGYGQKLQSISGGSATVSGSQLLALAATPGIDAITPDSPVYLSGDANSYSNPQLWPWASGVAAGWSAKDKKGPKGSAPAIAIVDSGIQKNRSDFNGGSILANVQIANGPDNSDKDGYGHGTFVAGIAAGGARGYTGAAPAAPIVSLDVLDDQGNGKVSDVIAACDWILQNEKKFNIGVANFSLTGSTPASVFWDPLDRAVEKLWFSGVTVVAAAGNYASNGQASGVVFAPANDPFVITVGADDLQGTLDASDDTAAPWSAWGSTIDGFSKPDISAPGRYMIGPVPAKSTLATTRASSMVGNDYIQLSGTSFAAPVVAGAAAQLLAQHPDWTPDQVKGALMLTAQATPAATFGSEGVGLIDAAAAHALQSSPPNPNLVLDRFVTPDPAGGPGLVFNTSSWQQAALDDPAWDAAAWGTAAWGTAAWGTAAWGTAAWGTAAWGTAAWGTAAWGTAAWGTAAWGTVAAEDNASSDSGQAPMLDAAQASEASSKLGFRVNPDGSIG